MKLVSKYYILCAAIWFQDGIKHLHQPINIDNGLVVLGYRHGNCFYTTMVLKSMKQFMNIQGFLTSKNRFVDRIEAKKIAYNASQIDSLDGNKELFSEDLYSCKISE